MSATQEAAIAVKARPSHRAARAVAWAQAMANLLATQNTGRSPAWQVVNFLGSPRDSARGIVDLLALRKAYADAEPPLKRGDLFEIVLIHIKIGEAKRPSLQERERLSCIAQTHGAKAVLLSEWYGSDRCVLSQLLGRDWGAAVDAELVFRTSPDGAPRPAHDDTDARAALQKLLSVPSAAALNKSSSSRKAWAVRLGTAGAPAHST